MMRYRFLALSALFAFTVAPLVHSGEGGFKPLFNGTDLKDWKFEVRPNKDSTEKPDAAKAFTVKNGEIQITGDPWGYMYTPKSYKNYVLSYTWSFPKDQPEKTTMNTGLLVHIQPPHKVWPHSVEPQGRYMDHGKLFFIGFDKNKQKFSQEFDEEAHKKAIKPAHEWNTTEVTVRGDGSVEVRLNGTLINKGKSELTEGPIGFQSEGSRFHIKEIKIKSLD